MRFASLVFIAALLSIASALLPKELEDAVWAGSFTIRHGRAKDSRFAFRAVHALERGKNNGMSDYNNKTAHFMLLRSLLVTRHLRLDM